MHGEAEANTCTCAHTDTHMCTHMHISIHRHMHTHAHTCRHTSAAFTCSTGRLGRALLGLPKRLL